MQTPTPSSFMPFFYISFGLLLGLPLFAQHAAVARSGIKDNIAKLSWESLRILPEPGGNQIDWARDSAVWKLKQAPMRSTARHLKDSLLVPEKTVIIYLLLLSQEGVTSFSSNCRLRSIPIYQQCDSLVGTQYFYQDIYWVEYKDGQRLVPPEVLTYIAKKWGLRASPYYSPHRFDGLLTEYGFCTYPEFELVRNRLERIMSIQASCATGYANNSSAISLSKLSAVIGEPSQSKKAQRFLSTLGPDYVVDTSSFTIYHELDDTQVSDYAVPEIDTIVNKYDRFYPNDGVSVTLVDTKALASIILHPGYKGETPVPIGEPILYDDFKTLVKDWSYEGKETYVLRKKGIAIYLYLRAYEKPDPTDSSIGVYYAEIPRLTIYPLRK